MQKIKVLPCQQLMYLVFHAINAALEVAQQIKLPIIIQFSNHGSQFLIGNAIKNDVQKAAVEGALAGASYIHQAAKAYQVSVILHTDHCNQLQLPWVLSLIESGKSYYNQYKKPLFSGHMLDLSLESLEDNLNTCCDFLNHLSALDMYLEMELGVTGGVEGEQDNTSANQDSLYTKSIEISQAFEHLSQVSPHFLIAASFGNVHGAYQPGKVKLKPQILDQAQKYIQAQFKTPPKPVSFVFHGGSGSSLDEIHQAISYGVVKMNVDTDLQWAFWRGVQKYTEHHKAYLQTQIGNPDGTDQSNKKYYSPMNWLRKGEKAYQQELLGVYQKLKVI